MKENIILIIIDSMNARKFFGNENVSLTPNFDYLIKNGSYFEKAYSSADSTLLAITSIFTGKHPFKTGIRSDKFNKLSKDVKTCFDVLKKNSYNFYAFKPTVTKTIGLLPKFENNDCDYYYHFDLHDGLGDKIIDLLEGNKMKQPWIFYTHLHDLHFPISVAENFNDEKFGFSNYERQVSAIDYWIGKIIKKIDFENTILVITSDHGVFIPAVRTKDHQINFEVNAKKQMITSTLTNKIPNFLKPFKSKMFYLMEDKQQNKLEKFVEKLNLKPHEKRGLLWRRGDLNKYLFDENVHVPLLMVGSKIEKNKIISKQVRTMDIFPTIFQIINIQENDDLDGESLVPYIQGKECEDKIAYFESTPSLQKTANEVIGLSTSKYKYFRDRITPKKRVHLFDLQNDPYEDHNIADENPKIIEEMENLLSTIRNEKTIKVDEYSEAETKAIEEELKKLGYD